jgi:hypothetical protein
MGGADLRCGKRLGKIRWDEDSSGASAAQLRAIFWISKKTDLALGCFSQGCRSPDFLLAVPVQFATRHGGDFLESKCHLVRAAWAMATNSASIGDPS